MESGNTRKLIALIAERHANELVFPIQGVSEKRLHYALETRFRTSAEQCCLQPLKHSSVCIL